MQHTKQAVIQLNLPFGQGPATITSRQVIANRTAHKQWWGPLWRGLAVEETAKHYRAMGMALWLYIYLIVHANRKTGVLFRLLPTIAAEMGVPIRTVQYWLGKLRKGGYVTTASNGRGLTIMVEKWKPLKPHNAFPKAG